MGGDKKKKKSKKDSKKQKDSDETKQLKKEVKKLRKDLKALQKAKTTSSPAKEATPEEVLPAASVDMRDVVSSVQSLSQQISFLRDTLSQVVSAMKVLSPSSMSGGNGVPRRAPPPPPLADVVISSNLVPKHPPARKKIWIHARYKMFELSFHEQLWRDMGFEITREPCSDWSVRWSMRLQPNEWSSFQPWQKTNFIPGVGSLIRKDNLHRSIVAMQRRFGRENFDFWPESFNLPEEWSDFAECAKNRLPNVPWILKPPASSCGRRIRVVPSFADMTLTPHDDWVQQNHPLAQRYLNTPLLDGRKFTFRVYVVLTGVDPLRIYIYGDGLCRIASRPYRLDKESFDDPFIHLDSIDINEKNTDVEELKVPTLETEGLRSSIVRVLEHLEKTQGAKKEHVWNQIKEVIVKSILCAESDMLGGVRKLVRFRNCCFDLLGYDILLDENLKPWIIEINHSPSMAPLTEMENRIKHAMLSDYFSLADLTLRDREPLRELCKRACAVVKAMQQSSSKPTYTEQDYEQLHASQQPLDLSRLSEKDIFTLVSRFLESERKGGFECVFPSVDMLAKYGPFYRHDGRNVLHQLWIKERRTISQFFN